VPFQFDISMSSPSARPYEHASVNVWVKQVDNVSSKGGSAHQLRDPSLLSLTPPEV
jgi:hypothetical protein